MPNTISKLLAWTPSKLFPYPCSPINVPVNQPVIPPTRIQTIPVIKTSTIYHYDPERGDIPLPEPAGLSA
jgi:hypothetical protein